MADVVGMLEAAGVQGIRDTHKEVVAKCPMHFKRTGKDDTHPSWSINKNTYAHYCFSCGYKGTLQTLLVDLTGSAPADLEMELHRESFLRRMEARDQPDEVLEPVLPMLTEWALNNILVDVPRRMLDRRWLLRSAIDRYQVRWNSDTKQWVLPMWDIRGDLMGAQYKQSGSVYTLPEGMSKSLSIFGYQQVKCEDWAVLVESPLDAVRLDGLGIPAFATLGAFVSKEQATLMSRLFSYVILALDDDKAGHQGAEIATAMLRKRKCGVLHWDYTGLVDKRGEPAKDVGDVPNDDALLDAFDRTRRFGV